MKPLFKKITHFAVVVKDLNTVVSNYTNKYGIGPWSIYECGPKNISDMRVNGKKIDCSFNLAICYLGNTSIEAALLATTKLVISYV